MVNVPDFDLEIAIFGDAYTVEVQSAYGVGELPPQRFELPLDLRMLPQARRDVGDWIKQARITRLSGSAELREAREFGGALFERLFDGEVLASFRTSRKALPHGQRLCVRLRLPDKLTTLPWELLYDKRDDQFLALAPDLTLVRYPELPITLSRSPINGPIQLVAVLASPAGDDYPAINLDRELRRIESALRDQIKSGRVMLNVIRGRDTLGQLRARLRRPIHILHILCHGELDSATGEGVLIFEDADGAAEQVNAELIRMQIQKQLGQTRLVLLNACLGALSASDDAFSSVGAALLRGGVPAVIAMQFEIAEDAAAELTRIFYSETASGISADLAMAEARAHLYGRYPTRLDWAIPVLFMHGDNGVLFDPLPLPVAVPALDTPEPPALTPPAGATFPRWLFMLIPLLLLIVGMLGYQIWMSQGIAEPRLIESAGAPTGIPVDSAESATSEFQVSITPVPTSVQLTTGLPATVPAAIQQPTLRIVAPTLQLITPTSEPPIEGAHQCNWIDELVFSLAEDAGRGISSQKDHYDYAMNSPNISGLSALIESRMSILKGCLHRTIYANVYADVSVILAKNGRDSCGWVDKQDFSLAEDTGRGISSQVDHYKYAIAASDTSGLGTLVASRMSILKGCLDKDSYANVYADVAVTVAKYGRDN